MILARLGVDVVAIDSGHSSETRVLARETMQHVLFLVLGAVALVALMVGVTRAGKRVPTAQRSATSQRLTGTIVSATGDQLVVATDDGQQFVLERDPRHMVLRTRESIAADLNTVYSQVR